VVVSPDGGATLLTVNSQGQLQPFDAANLQFFTSLTALAHRQEFVLFDRVMSIADRGVYDLYIGYTPDDSRRVEDILYSTTPLQLRVT